MSSKQAIQDHKGSLEYLLHLEAKEKVDKQVGLEKLAQKEVEVILDQQEDLACLDSLDQKVRMGNADRDRKQGSFLCYSSFNTMTFALTWFVLKCNNSTCHFALKVPGVNKVSSASWAQ